MFQNRHAVRTELTWTHYRSLLRVEEEALYFYPIANTLRAHLTRTMMIILPLAYCYAPKKMRRLLNIPFYMMKNKYLPLSMF